MQPASISSRFAAMNLDMIIFGAIWQAMSIGIEKTAPEFATPGILLGLCFVVSLFYFVVPTKASGQTIGKKLLNLKVIPERNVKGRVSWKQAILREVVGKWVSSVPFFLGYIWSYFQRDRRAWHDLIGGTEVISLVWEDEKTTAQKLQQILLAIISVPAGVALVTVAFLYTSLPLDSIKEKIEASGIQVGELTGSLAGGLHFSDISRKDPGQNFSVHSVDVKFNLWTLLTDNVFYIEKISAEEGRVEVPEDFSLMVIFSNLLAAAQFQETTGKVRDITMAKFHLKNIYFEHNKTVLSHLQEFLVKNMAIANNELYLNEMNFQIVGFMVKAQDVRSSFGRVEIAKATGGVTPEFLPMLKAPVDFHLNGTIGKNPKDTQLDAGLVIDKIKIGYAAGKLAATVDQLILNEVFKMSVPVDELNMKLAAEGTTVTDMLSTLQVEYGVKVCGQEFLPDPVKGPSLVRGDRQFNFRMMPLPVLDFSQVVFAKEATLDDLFGYELRGSKQVSPSFASTQEMISDLCFQKNVASLQPAEIEGLKPLEKVVQAPKAIAFAEPKKEETSAPPPVAVEMPVASSPSEAVKLPATSAELMKTVMNEAKSLMKQGKVIEANTLLETTPIATDDIAPAEVGAFYNVKAWVYLYSNNPSQAAQNFESAFNARKDIGDAEGLQRSYEALKNDQEAQKWWDYIKSAVKANPGLKNQLTPNMQRKLASEVSAESPQ